MNDSVFVGVTILGAAGLLLLGLAVAVCLGWCVSPSLLGCRVFSVDGCRASVFIVHGPVCWCPVSASAYVVGAVTLGALGGGHHTTFSSARTTESDSTAWSAGGRLLAGVVTSLVGHRSSWWRDSSLAVRTPPLSEGQGSSELALGLERLRLRCRRALGALLYFGVSRCCMGTVGGRRPQVGGHLRRWQFGNPGSHVGPSVDVAGLGPPLAAQEGNGASVQTSGVECLHRSSGVAAGGLLLPRVASRCQGDQS